MELAGPKMRNWFSPGLSWVEAEECSGAALVSNQNPQLIQHFLPAEFKQARTLVGRRHDFVQIVIQKLRQSGDSMETLRMP